MARTKLSFEQIKGNVVSVKDYGASLDGTDDTAAMQAAHDALPNGGTILVSNPSGGTLALSIVNITNKNITIDIDRSVTLKKYGNGGASARGMFYAIDLIDLNFKLNFGTCDLNGEGCREIGVAGRIANTYATQTTPPIKAISGPLNELFYGVRCTGIEINGDLLKNSGETGILYRNCAGTVTNIKKFENFGNGAIEINFPNPADDGGSGTVPVFEGYTINSESFKHINDFGLGSGNGTGILIGGGVTAITLVSNVRINVNNFEYCLRDIQTEFSGGGYLSEFDITYNSRYCQQGSLGLVSGRNGTVKANIFRPCGPGAAALNSGFPDIYGAIFSTDITFCRADVRVMDTRDEIVTTGSDGAITAGATTFTSAGASFVAGDVGKMLSWSDGCDTDCVFESKITAINSTTSVEVELPAPLTVSGKDYAYGGCARFGVVARNVASLDLADSKILAGKNSGIGSEPTAIGLDINNPTGNVRLNNVEVIAPALSAGTAPEGCKISTTFTGKLFHEGLYVDGFTENFKNFEAQKTAPRNMSFIKLTQRADPSATINTYGTEITLTPKSSYILICPAISIETTGISSETLTSQVIFYGPGGVSNTVDITSVVDEQIELTGQQLATLHTDNGLITSIGFKVKSSIGSSAAYARVTIVGCER